MIHFLLLALAVNPISIHIQIDGSGFLRFDHHSKLRYSSESTLVARDGVLQTTDGDILIPQVHVPANCREIGVNLDGQVFALSSKGPNQIGQLVLTLLPDTTGNSAMFESSLKGPSSNPGEGLAGVIRSSVSVKGVASTLVPSNDPLNLVIDGPGFFKILQIDGSYAYTRKGEFQLDSLGDLVTPDNRLVSPKITFPAGATSITVDQDGTISYVKPGDFNPTILGQITLTTFMNPSRLRRTYRNVLVQTQASGTPCDVTPGFNGSGFIERRLVEASTLSFINGAGARPIAENN